MTHVLAALLGYTIGSFPTAYLVVKWKSNIDIRRAGSGNVGTLNSFEVTNSKTVGAIVLCVDLLKGALAVLLVKDYLGNGFGVIAAGGIASVLGHNFPVWIGFHGGRGLAPAAGVMFMVSWIMVMCWGAAWFIGKKLVKEVNVANAIATLALSLIVFVVPFSLMTAVIPEAVSVNDFRIFVVILCVAILIRLIRPVREYYSHHQTS